MKPPLPQSSHSTFGGLIGSEYDNIKVLEVFVAGLGHVGFGIMLFTFGIMVYCSLTRDTFRYL